MGKEKKPAPDMIINGTRQDLGRINTKDQMHSFKAMGKLNEQTQELRKSINTFVTGQGAKNPFLQNNASSEANRKPSQQSGNQAPCDPKTSKK